MQMTIIQLLRTNYAWLFSTTRKTRLVIPPRLVVSILVAYTAQLVILLIAILTAEPVLAIEIKQGSELVSTVILVANIALPLITGYISYKLWGIFRFLWKWFLSISTSTFCASGYHLACKIKTFAFWTGSRFTDIVYENNWICIRAVANAQDQIKAATDCVAQLAQKGGYTPEVLAIYYNELIVVMRTFGINSANRVKLMDLTATSVTETETFFWKVGAFAKDNPGLVLVCVAAAVGVGLIVLVPYCLSYCFPTTAGLVGAVIIAPIPQQLTHHPVTAVTTWYGSATDFTEFHDTYAIARADYLRRWPQDENAPS